MPKNQSIFLLTVLVISFFGTRQPCIAQCTESGFWNEVAPMPEPRHQTSSAAVDDKIYVFGDFNHSANNDSLLIYDTTSNNWSDGASIPTGRGQTAATMEDGKIYLMAGNNCFSNCWLTTNEVYDPQTNSWSSLSPAPGHGRGLLSAVAVDGKIYLMGGANSYIVPTFSYNHIYDPVNDSWTKGPSIPRPRSKHAAAVLGKKIYLVGGEYRLQHNEEVPVPEVDVFNTVTGQWSQVAPLPTSRVTLTAVAMNGKIYAIGGQELLGPNGGYGGYVNLVDEYDPVLNCWKQVTALPIPHGLGTAQVVDSHIYLLGGQIACSTAGGPGCATTQTLKGYPLPISSEVYGDLDNDSDVDRVDLNIMRALVDNDCLSADVSGDGIVDVDDLGDVFVKWGICPE